MHSNLKKMTASQSHRQLMQRWHDERGMALIVAIVLLAVMSLMGATLMSLSTSEIQLTSNYRDSRQAFYAADRATEYAIKAAATSSSDVDLYNDTDSGGTLHRSYIKDGKSGLDPSGDNLVSYIGTGTPPVGIGSDATTFKALNYAISTVGIYPDTPGHSNPSRAVVSVMVAKIVPK